MRFAPGIMDKHYEKLLQCDHKMQLLSRSSFPTQESLYFDANAYGLSEFPIEFNAYGPQVFGGMQMQYPYSISPGLPIHVQNFSQATRPPFQIMNSNSPMSGII